MITSRYLGALIGITIVLVIFVITITQVAATEELESGSESFQVENSTNHDNWQRLPECKGLVFESIEEAEAAAKEMGCSGYHEHHKKDGTVLYMPCATK